LKIGVLHLTFDADEQWISDRPMTQPVMLRNWQQVVEKVDFAFQPIVSPHTGHVFGYEALLRRWEEAGFTSIQALFDTAWDTGNLHSVDMMLRAKAIEKFARFPGAKRLKLFYNFDNRVVKTEDYQPGQTAALLSDAGLERDTIFLEISERHDISNAGYLKDILVRYRSQGFKIAIDDYGSGFAQLRALYECEPDIIKIDRFFIDGIDRDRRKELFVTQITAFAHMIAAQVVAEGVETREEFLCCRRLGCDLVQGFFIARPSLDIPEQTDIVSSAADIAADSRRQSDRDDDVVRSYLLETSALPSDINPVDILTYFQQNPDISLIPVVNQDGEPLGIVRDSEFKAFIYTPFGRELLQNPANRANIKRFLRRCPIADIRTSLSELLETFVATEALDGVILTENGQYLGVLDQSALLRAVNERNTLNARDENPLTRLPATVPFIVMLRAPFPNRGGAGLPSISISTISNRLMTGMASVRATVPSFCSRIFWARFLARMTGLSAISVAMISLPMCNRLTSKMRSRLSNGFRPCSMPRSKVSMTRKRVRVDT